MKIDVRTESGAEPLADWLVVGAFEEGGTSGGAIAELLGPRLAALRASGDFEGKPNELVPLYGAEGLPARAVLLVGLGKADRFSRRTIFQASYSAARFLSKKPRGSVLLPVPGPEAGQGALANRVADLVAGFLAGMVGQDLYRREKVHHPIESLQLLCRPDEQPAAREGLERGRVLGDATNLVRQLVNIPPAEIYPESFCERALEIAGRSGLQTEVLDGPELTRLKMHCILGVGMGSERPPRLLVLRYSGNPSDARWLCFVGKGITFDSGGLSLKTAEGMATMKCDMAGAATVLAATAAVAQLRVPVNLLTVAALAENMPSGSALRPGDVLTAKNGKTIEIVNTDAEGRLVLADALAHAVDLGATRIVDLATLTGACVVALGTEVAGVMTNDDSWGQMVLDAARRTGELAWQLPMFPEYDELIKSDIADMKNSGGRWGGAISAAKLLAEFVGQVPWAHVDIAGPSFVDKETGTQVGGGTGYFTRTLVELAEAFAREPERPA